MSEQCLSANKNCASFGTQNKLFFSNSTTLTMVSSHSGTSSCETESKGTSGTYPSDVYPSGTTYPSGTYPGAMSVGFTMSVSAIDVEQS